MENKSYIFKFLVMIALVVSCILIFIVSSTNDHTYTVTITHKERIIQQIGESIDSKYLIYGEDENGKSYTFENTDILIRGKINSSDIYGALKEDETYNITVIGFRAPLFSWYENIISFEKVG